MRYLIALSLLIPGLVTAGSVTLAWTVVSDARVVGYQILYGTESGEYTYATDVPGGRETGTHTIQNLNPATKYYFAARSYILDKAEYSANSNEVSATVPLSAPGSLSVTMGTTVSAPGSFLGAPLGVGS